jgi:hypothetical protein
MWLVTIEEGEPIFWTNLIRGGAIRGLRLFMIVQILGRRYKMQFVNKIDDNGTRGFCDKPTAKNKKIVIEKGMPPQEELEVTIHELLHAADWHKDEEWVEEVGKDIARILYRLGYRKIEE